MSLHRILLSLHLGDFHTNSGGLFTGSRAKGQTEIGPAVTAQAHGFYHSSARRLVVVGLRNTVLLTQA